MKPLTSTATANVKHSPMPRHMKKILCISLGINEYKWIEEKGLERYLTNLTAVTQLGNLQNVYNHELVI